MSNAVRRAVSMSGVDAARLQRGSIPDEPVLSAVSSGPAALRYHGPWRHAKRGLDLAVVLLSLPVTLPAAAAVALMVKLASRGPVLFKQQRLGKDGKMITVYKFRTMYVDSMVRLREDAELYRRYVENDFKLAVHEDPRIVGIGRFLRATSLDELPQLFNVLNGSMSLVGPRPIVVEELECYGRWKWAYLASKPGITGRWQCQGRNHVRYPQRAMNDAKYLENWTLWSDIWILLKTIPAVIRRHGAH